MRILKSLVLCLLLSTVALPQGKPIFERQSDLEFGGAEETVVAHKFVEGENKLVLVGRKVVRVLDVASGKFSESRPVDVPEFNEDRPREFSPDGRFMLVFGNYDSEKKEDKVKRPPTVWDLRTGKQVATLDKTREPIRAGFWSKNGRTLATSSAERAPNLALGSSVEVSFWDGETFEYRNSLPTDRAAWWRLTEDGEKCIFSTGEVIKRGISVISFKYVSPGGPVSVWDIKGAKVERTISARGGRAEWEIRFNNLSPDERFLTMVVQPPKSKDAERRLAVWEIDRSHAAGPEAKPKYEVKPPAKIAEYGPSFSPDGKYFALQAGKNLQIHETRTGEKRFELTNFDRPGFWLTDDILYTTYRSRMEAFDFATGKLLYELKLIYKANSYLEDYPDSNPLGSADYPKRAVTEVLDETKIAVHPSGRMFLTHSKQYVQIFDSRAGALLQTLVEPPVDNTKKKPKTSDEPLVSTADWSADGRVLYVISADKRRVSLWRLA
ncbi:MAG TPA: WD40 repeat domain-containing protein [Pyrinomonadaceae bacterium]|nr:WD40 repeat domain-containing protein [Pyrinomonadaceae bacterium]